MPNYKRTNFLLKLLLEKKKKKINYKKFFFIILLINLFLIYKIAIVLEIKESKIFHYKLVICEVWINYGWDYMSKNILQKLFWN